jgi:predicted transcriptional regulator
MSTSHQQSITMHHQTADLTVSATNSPSNHLDAVPQRIREIAMLRGLGYSFRQIAQEFSVTPQAVSLMLSRHRKTLKSLRGAFELNNLSARAVNALGRHGIRTREEARRQSVLEMLKNERNCGRKTLGEIEQWLDGGNGQS